MKIESLWQTEESFRSIIYSSSIVFVSYTLSHSVSAFITGDIRSVRQGGYGWNWLGVLLGLLVIISNLGIRGGREPDYQTSAKQSIYWVIFDSNDFYKSSKRQNNNLEMLCGWDKIGIDANKKLRD